MNDEATEPRLLQSWCHRYKGSFTPEEGSPADIRRKDRLNSKGYGTKFHVKGSDCQHVRGKYSFLHSDRTFHPNHFEVKPREQCCQTCVEFYKENYEQHIH